MKTLAINTQIFQQETRAVIQNLGNQISQLAFSLNKIEANERKLPSQPKINPRENASTMTLQSVKEV